MDMRTVEKMFPAIGQEEGAGARVRRSIGTYELPRLDPFLLLDEFFVDSTAGFPDHPHRGFETVTYMIQGAFEHEDFCGHRGVIKAGDLQWMTAGKGIVHAEMPATNQVNRGMQLWINLSKEFKMIEPAYQEMVDKDIPRTKVDDGKVEIKVIAGESHGVTSPVITRTPIQYLDVQIQPGGKVQLTIPDGYNSFAYILEGTGFIGSAEVQLHHMCCLSSKGSGINATSECYMRFILLAGKPIKEPVAHRGPFVMNTNEELQKTFDDYFTFKNGFEKAKNWKSEIGQRNK